MNPALPAAAEIAPHRVRTRNVSLHSANKIHDNATAARYGFRGGLVPGVLVYAHLATPLVRHFGVPWLEGSVSELKLLSPAYDGEWLTISAEPAEAKGEAEALHLVARNEAGEALATLTTHLPAALPPPDPRAALAPAPADAPQVPIAWEAVRIGEPLRALDWVLGRAEHEQWCDAAGDDLPLFRAGERPRIQPGRALRAANEVLGQHYQLEPWIHTGSRVIQRGALHLGDAVEVRAVPSEKWERKGHQFLTLYVALLCGGKPVLQVHHSAIFRLRPAQA